MRRVAFAIVGLSLFGWQLLGGCESDVANNGTPTGTGGQGAATTTTITTSSTAGSGGGTGGSGGDPGCTDCTNDCEYACYKIEQECDFGLPITCDQIPGNMLDCEDNTEAANCNGACILAADCDDLPSILTSNPDPDLAACMQECADPCQNCLFTSCQEELLACYEDATCQAFLNCLDTEVCTEWPCVEGCLTDHESDASTAVASCACDTCGTDCTYCTSGSGGGGQGGSGQGGSGGN